MPAISSGKVLVSGANGFIAMWVIKKLLEDGFSVRGTVRSESKGVHLKETFKEYESKLEVVVVEDFTKVRDSSRRACGAVMTQLFDATCYYAVF